MTTDDRPRSRGPRPTPRPVRPPLPRAATATATDPSPGRAVARPTGARSATAIQGRIEGLDGIRAVAVVAVIAYHLWPARLPGGFLGVDVFFVISGFLITTLLLREHATTGRVDLGGFWLRRARRLLPALVVVVAVSVTVAALVEHDLLVGIGRQVLGASTFSTNWLEIHHGADYFDATSPTLFLTFWSLAVEEQFYVVWPVAALALVSAVRTPRLRIGVVLGIGAASAGLMAALFVPGGNPTRVYYGTDTHLVGLMVGAAVALAFEGGVGGVATARWEALRRWIGFAGLGAVGLLLWQVESSSTFTYRGGIVLTSVLTAVIVACLPGSGTAFTRILRAPVLAWFGERSYGLYLWHWPIILIVTELLPASSPGAEPTAVVAGLAIGATLLLTEVSHRWVEGPIRRGGFQAVTGTRLPRPALLAGGFAVVALVGGVIATAPDTSGAQRSVEEGQRQIEEQASIFEGGSTDGLGSTSTTASVGTTTVPPPAWPVGQDLPAGDQIIGFGDSVLSGAAPAVYERFTGILLDAKPIRQWKDAPALVERAVQAGVLRPVVVLNFGTNAGLQSEESQQALRTVLDLLGPGRRIVLVNTVGVSGWVPETNARLAEISAEHPNTAVMDWKARVDRDPGLLHTDRTHPNIDGIAVYADLLASTIEQLGPG